MTWINAEYEHPLAESYVLLWRKEFPSFYWMGAYKEYEIFDETDEFSHWMEIPKPPH